MKKILFGLSAILFCVTLPAQENPLYRYIPTGTRVICSFNPVKLAAQVPGDSFRASAMYREIMKKDDADLKRFFADPSISGIDFNRELWIISKDVENKTPTKVNIFGVLKDEAQFAKMIEKVKDNKTVHRYGTNRILMTDDGGSLAWNDEVFVISAGKNRNWDVSVSYPDDTSTETSFKYMEEVRDKTFRAARDNCFELLTPRSAIAFPGLSAFREMMTVTGDIKIWTDGTPNKLLQGIHPMAGMISKFMKMAGGNKTTIINFENGKIHVETRSYLDEAMADLYRKYPPAPLPAMLTRRLPEGKLLGMSLSSLNTELVREMLRQSGIDLNSDSVKSKMPVDLNLLGDALKNQVMFAVFKSDEPVQPESKLKGIDLVIAVPVRDKAKFEELKSVVKQLMDKEKQSGKTDKLMKDLKPVLRYNGELAVLALTEKSADAFLSNPGTGSEPAWLQAYQGYPMVTHIDLREIFNLLLSNMGKDLGSKEVEVRKILGAFGGLTFTGGNFENNRVNGLVEMNFTNQDNAFLQLFNLANTAIEEGEKRRIEREKQWKMDDMEETESQKDSSKPSPPPPPPAPAPKKKGN